METMISTDVLIVGSGPAGATASLLLSTYGIDNIVVTRWNWTAQTPRAHITNQRTMEILRDMGIEEEATRDAVSQSNMANNVFCESLVGEEFGRIHSWGNHPTRLADYTLASPSHMCDLPQNYMEPLLLTNAVKRGAKLRLNTEFVSFVQDKNGVTATVKDHVKNETYKIKAKYLIGADGSNSLVAEQAKLPMAGQMGIAGSMNLIFEADLTEYVAHRPSVLYCVIQPEAQIGGVGMGIVRMIRPWKRWMIVWGYDISQPAPEVSDEFAIGVVRSLVGVKDLKVKIISKSLWTVNNCWAEKTSNGRVFCVGDAIHRHPPTNGLGSNTSMADSYNLAWKLAYALKGWAGEDLTKSYDQERAPVAAQIVSRAVRSIGEYGPIFGALGLGKGSSRAALAEGVKKLKENSAEGRAQRAQLRAAIKAKDYEYNAHGVELNQRYVSNAVKSDGTPKKTFARDEELYHEATTVPGAKIPHAWLHRGSEKLSTLDVVGSGQLSIVTGIGGDAWISAAKTYSDSSGVPIRTVSIGHGLEFQDTFADWETLREVEEDGCLLIRPDGVVAWRVARASTDAGKQLKLVLNEVLCRT
jgi:2,4-dichlorophenol 6-monooxygenase